MVEWDSLYNKVNNLIKFMSKRGRTMKSVLNTPEDLYQEGQIYLYKLYEMYKYDKTEKDIIALFKTSFTRYIRDMYEKHEFTVVDLEDAYEIGITDDIVNEIYEAYFIEQVQSLLQNSPIATIIFNELIEPSDKLVDFVLEEFERKQKEKAEGKRKQAPRFIRVKSSHIMQVHNITRRDYSKGLGEIKQAYIQVKNVA